MNNIADAMDAKHPNITLTLTQKEFAALGLFIRLAYDHVYDIPSKILVHFLRAYQKAEEAGKTAYGPDITYGEVFAEEIPREGTT